jgi:hypothetical protein
VSYRIEYMTETTEENTVCHTLLTQSANLQGAAAEAFDKADVAKELFGATGFQIRHLNAVDKIVAIANFDNDNQ